MISKLIRIPTFALLLPAPFAASARTCRLAEKSGHFIQKDQPDLVIQAIRDVIPH